MVLLARAINSAGECYLDVVEVTSSILVSPIRQLVCTQQISCLIFCSVQKSGGTRVVVGSPGSSHELEEEVFIVDKSIRITFDDLGEVVRSLQLT